MAALTAMLLSPTHMNGSRKTNAGDRYICGTRPAVTLSFSSCPPNASHRSCVQNPDARKTNAVLNIERPFRHKFVHVAGREQALNKI